MIAPRRAPLTLMTFWKFRGWIILVYSCADNVLFICFGLQIIKVGFFSSIYINNNFENEPINEEFSLLNKFLLLSSSFCSLYPSST